MIKKTYLTGGILFIVFLLMTSLLFAQTNDTTSDTKTAYVPNQIIVKLKGSAALNLQAQLLTRANTINMTARSTGAPIINAELDAIFRSNGVVSVRPLADGFYRRMRTTGKTADQLRQTMTATHNYRNNNTTDIQSFTIEDIFILTTQEGVSLTGLIETLNTLPDVAYAEPNMIVRITALPNDPYYSSSGSWGQSYDDLWGLKAIDAGKAWDTSLGQGVLVAVVDTGIDYEHEDIRDNIWTNPGEIPGNNIDDDNNGYVDDYYGYDFEDNDNDPTDDVGHGTHCAGTIAGVGNNGLGVIGVAPAAKVMAVRGLDLEGGSNEQLARAVYYAIENGADVISNSWGGQGSSKVLEEVFDYAYSLGIVCVAGAGNDAIDVANFSPAGIDSVISVAASLPRGGLANFSNFGSKIDVTAPGVDVLSTLTDGDIFAGPYRYASPNYYRMDGTSMACPHVAGVAALLMSHYKKADFNNYPEAIRTIITDSATPFTQNPDKQGGSGIVNAANAFNVPLVADLDVAGYTITELEGNGNGIIESHEKVAVTVTIRNRGLKAATGLQAVLQADSHYITDIPVSQVTLGSIAQGETVEFSTLPFIIQTGDIPTHGAKDSIGVTLSISLTGNEGLHQTYTIETLFGVRTIYHTDSSTIGNIKVSNDYVVWVSVPPTSVYGALYMYDKKTGATVKLLSAGVSLEIDLDKSKLVFSIAPEDLFNHDIFCYDLSTDTLEIISNAPGNQSRPRISDDHIMWQDYRNDKVDIYLHTISTGVQKQITNTLYDEMYLESGDGKAAWRKGTKIMLYDVAAGTTKEITPGYINTGYHIPTAVSGKYVAYSHEYTTGGTDRSNAYIYTITNGKIMKLTTLTGLPETGSTKIIDIVGDTIYYSYMVDHLSSDNHYQAYNMDTGEVKEITGMLDNYEMGVGTNEVAWGKKSTGSIYLSSFIMNGYKEEVNLSLLPETKVFVSSEFAPEFPKEHAIDGKDNTAWGSAAVINDEKPLIYLDLGKSYELTKLLIKFYKGYHASSLLLGVSNDMKKWTTATLSSDATLELDIAALRLRSRYIGMQCLEGPGGIYGVLEFEVWGNRIIIPPNQPTSGAPATLHTK